MIDPLGFFASFREFVSYVGDNARKSGVAIVLLLAAYGSYEAIGTFVPLFGAAYKAKLDSIEKAAVSYQKINLVLTADRAATRASRIMLMQFHDSKKDILGVDFFFVSETNAVSAPWTTLDVQNLQDVPASVYMEKIGDTSVLQELVAHRPVHFEISKMDDGYLKQLMQSQGTKYAAWVGIYGLDDHIIGFITEGWLNLSDVPTGDEMNLHLQQLQRDADRISGWLSDRIK